MIERETIPARDLCPHCKHPWHGLPCERSGVSYRVYPATESERCMCQSSLGNAS